MPSIPSTIRRNFDLENSTNGKRYSGIEESTLGKRIVDRRWISSNYESFKQIETSVIFFRTEMSRGFQYNTNSLARLDGEKIARKGIGGRKMKISFSRSAITRHEARDRSLEHELIEKRGGVAVHGSKDAEGEEKEKRRQRSVDLLLSL